MTNVGCCLQSCFCVLYFNIAYLWQREWAEAKKELQEERDKSRTLTHERDEAVKNVIRQAENFSKELSDALNAGNAAEARAADAEVNFILIETIFSSFFCPSSHFHSIYAL